MGGHSPIGKPLFLYLGVSFVDFGTILGALALIMGTEIHMNFANCLDPGPWDPYGTRHPAKANVHGYAAGSMAPYLNMGPMGVGV